MRQISLGDETDGASGIMAIVVAVLEIVLETMQREAVRRMESGTLTEEEIERLGSQLQAIEAELEAIKARQGIETDVARLRGDLDDLVADVIEQVRHEEGIGR